MLGLHFFSPANIMKLLEVVRGDKTGDDVLATCMSLAKRIRKVPVVPASATASSAIACCSRISARRSFASSRAPRRSRSTRPWKRSAWPWARCALPTSQASTSATRRAGASDEDERGDPRGYRVADVLLGDGPPRPETGAGFYRYDPETANTRAIPKCRRSSSARPPRSASSAARYRTTKSSIASSTVLVNEGMRIVEEGIAQRPGDIDVVYVYGYGFPAYARRADALRGRRSASAECMSVSAIFQQRNCVRAGGRCEFPSPAPLLERLATE